MSNSVEVTLSRWTSGERPGGPPTVEQQRSADVFEIAHQITILLYLSDDNVTKRPPTVPTPTLELVDSGVELSIVEDGAVVDDAVHEWGRDSNTEGDDADGRANGDDGSGDDFGMDDSESDDDDGDEGITGAIPGFSPLGALVGIVTVAYALRRRIPEPENTPEKV